VCTLLQWPPWKPRTRCGSHKGLTHGPGCAAAQAESLKQAAGLSPAKLAALVRSHPAMLCSPGGAGAGPASSDLLAHVMFEESKSMTVLVSHASPRAQVAMRLHLPLVSRLCPRCGVHIMYVL